MSVQVQCNIYIGEDKLCSGRLVFNNGSNNVLYAFGRKQESCNNANKGCPYYINNSCLFGDRAGKLHSGPLQLIMALMMHINVWHSNVALINKRFGAFALAWAGGLLRWRSIGAQTFDVCPHVMHLAREPV